MRKKLSITKEDLMQDKRFFIKESEAARIVWNESVKKYLLESVSLGDIRRCLNSRVFSIKETESYKYILDPENEKTRGEYGLYCKENTMEFEKHSVVSFDELIEQMDNEDYDIQKGVIVVNQLNIIVDGLHRTCYLLNKYGDDHKITVLKVFFKKMGVRTTFSNYLYNFRKLFKN